MLKTQVYSEHQFFFIGTEHVTFWKCKKRKTKDVMKQIASRIQTCSTTDKKWKCAKICAMVLK